MKPRRRTFAFWTMERRRELLALKAKLWSHEECAIRFGCKRTSVENILHRIRKEKGEVIRPYNRHASGNRHRSEATSRMALAAVEAKAVREHLPLPKTITALLCGDPLPGRSALDRKRNGTSDDVIFKPSKITLPMEPIQC